MPWISLLKCCQPIRPLSVSRFTLRDLEYKCVRACTFTNTNSCRKCIRTCSWLCCIYPHPHLCFSNLSEYIPCLLCVCVLRNLFQPVIRRDLKSLPSLFPCRLSVWCYHGTRCPESWLEMLSDGKSKTSDRFPNDWVIGPNLMGTDTVIGKIWGIWCRLHFSLWLLSF